MLRLLATVLMAGFLSIGTFTPNSTRVDAKAPVDNQVAATLNVFAEPFDEPHIVFHYRRSDANYASWDLWIWGQNEGGAEYNYTGQDDYGKYLYLPIDTFSDQTQVNVIIRPGGWSSQTGDINIQYADFTLQSDNAYHFYLVDMDENVYSSPEEVTAGRILSADFTSLTTIRVSTNIDQASFVLKVDGADILNGVTTDTYDAVRYRFTSTITIPGSHTVDLMKNYTIEITFADINNDNKIANVSIAGLFDTTVFINEMTYNGTDLGVTYSDEKTIFKAWAPTTSSLKLRLYENGTPVLIDPVLGDDTYEEYDFIRGEKGTWSVEVDGDLHGTYYTFVATNAAGTNELTDPYARAAGVNGLRGLIVDFEKTNPEGWDEVDFSVKKETEIIPYELHVADLTADDTWNGQEANRKKFLGLIEEGTTYTKGGVTVKTGFDHIKELGINALQILPFYDQENSEVNVSFNWGYNPKNYNVLEGSYSSNPHDGLLRINEFKQVVQKYAAEDIRIIMDVVYNHVANISGHSFSKLVPGYYFRYRTTGSPSNASGVGNDTASERIMMARYMTDSTYFLASEYKLGGFRFDLMGLHTVEAMNMLSNKLRQDYRDDIVLFGEAWDMKDDQAPVSKTLANYKNIDQTVRVGAFNDRIRNAIKGGNGEGSAGFIQVAETSVNLEMQRGISYGLSGRFYGSTDDPTKTVNYVSVHDNNTLFDKVQMEAVSFGYDRARQRQQALQAQSMVLTAQGISFLHAGSEILRSKPLGNGKFDHNSYQSSYEINSLKWDEKVDNLDIFNQYVKMVALKRDTPEFQYSTSELIEDNVTVEFGSTFGVGNSVIRMTVRGENKTYVVIFVASTGRVRLDLAGHKVLLDTSGTKETGEMLTDQYSIYANTTLILELSSGEPSSSETPTSTPPTSTPGSETPTSETDTPKTGCFGSIGSTIAISLALIGVGSFFAIKRKKLG